MACYKGDRYATGTCIPCRLTNSRRHTNVNRGPKAAARRARYYSSALGILERARDAVRQNARKRGMG